MYISDNRVVMAPALFPSAVAGAITDAHHSSDRSRVARLGSDETWCKDIV